MQFGGTSTEKHISLDDRLAFVSKADVAANDPNSAAYTIEGPEGYVVFIAKSTPVAPELRDADGNKLDSSTRVTIQKCDRQGNPIGNGIVMSELLGRFDYEKMRTDPDYFRKTKKDLMVDEREIVKVFLDIPDGSAGFSAANSRLTIGDDTSDFGKAVEVVEHNDLSEQESKAVKAASQRGN